MRDDAYKPVPTAKPRRRWFQFSLRTLLIVVMVLSGPFAWTAYQLNWLRERHEILPDGNTSSGPTRMKAVFHCGNGYAAAPWPLRLFGEAGCYALSTTFTDSSPEVIRLRRLFPEAEITCYPPDE